MAKIVFVIHDPTPPQNASLSNPCSLALTLKLQRAGSVIFHMEANPFSPQKPYWVGGQAVVQSGSVLCGEQVSIPGRCPLMAVVPGYYNQENALMFPNGRYIRLESFLGMESDSHFPIRLQFPIPREIYKGIGWLSQLNIRVFILAQIMISGL